MGDSLLIHEFAYSLFIGLCSVTSNMTGYSYLYHSIKLIHWGAPQTDVLSDKMVLWICLKKIYTRGEGGSGLKASATEEKLSILIGLALKLVSLRNHNLLGLKRLNEDVWVISFELAWKSLFW